MAQTKKKQRVFDKDNIAEDRLKMLACVFRDKSEETILAEALDLYWNQSLDKVNAHIQTLSMYAKYPEQKDAPSSE